MKNLVLGIIFSVFVTAGSLASVSSGLNFPDKKKKSKTEKKNCCKEEKKSCCPSKKDSKDCHSKSDTSMVK